MFQAYDRLLPKPVNEMTEDELRVEVIRLRAKIEVFEEIVLKQSNQYQTWPSTVWPTWAAGLAEAVEGEVGADA